MARQRFRPVSTAQQVTGYGILAILGLIIVWLLLQQARFNPAVIAQQVSLGQTGSVVGAGKGAGLTDLIPEVPGLTPLGPGQSFGPENLSDKIDGKAELYLSAGFQSLASRSFTMSQPAGAYLEVFLYDMGEAQNAYAVFSAQRRPGGQALSFTTNAYATANALFFTAGKFYVELVVDRAVDDLPSVLAPLTTAFLAKLPEARAGAAKTPADLFPPAGLIPNSVRLTATDAFGLAGFQNVYTAEYAQSDGPVTAFLAQRPDAAQAAAEARRYQEFLMANGFQVVSDPAIPPGITILALEDFYEAVLVVQDTLAGVHEAPSRATALSLALQLRQVLQSK